MFRRIYICASIAFFRTFFIFYRYADLRSELVLRIFKTISFARFARRKKIGDHSLCDAVGRIMKGLVDADLGGGIVKQRIARAGGGRSGGFRTIVLLRRDELAFFVYGFAKSDRENLRRREMATCRLLAEDYLAMDRQGLAAALAVGDIIEVDCDG